MPDSYALFTKGSTFVLDGGFGTTLEDIFHQDISHTPLWSAKVIREDPEVVIRTHLAFLEAGAQVILTPTYQCSHRTFAAAGYSPAEAEATMLQAVWLAAEARSRFLSTDLGSGKDVKIALSLGPFGATVQPAQEFDGYYPPPFGPTAYITGGSNRNAFTSAEMADGAEERSISALARFHLERLSDFAKNEDIWSKVDVVAFETVPLIREAIAIRRAVQELISNMKSADDGWFMKPWWISFVFPDGSSPQELSPNGPKVGTIEVVRAALCPDHGSVPNALGINCTRSEVLQGLIRDMELALSRLGVPSPGLVIYPNGGATYNPDTQTWSEGTKEGWAQGLCELASGVNTRGVWNGFIIGGCCKTSPDDISTLAKTLCV